MTGAAGPAVPADVFRDQPPLHGVDVTLVPLTEAVLDDYLLGLADPEVTRLTGSTATFASEAVRRWLATRADQHDGADRAVLRRTDSAWPGLAC